jgi:hypothetical protein
MSITVALRLIRNAFLGTFGLLVIWRIANYFLTGEIWLGLELSKSSIEGEYCELNNNSALFHQSMNTYSNLAYFFFGLIVWQIGVLDRNSPKNNFENKLKAFPFLSMLTGTVFMYLCFGSAFFHASLTKLSKYVDMNGTYGITFMLIAIGFYDVFSKAQLSIKTQRMVIVFLAILVLSFYQWYFLLPSSKLMPILMLLSVILTVTSIVKSYPRKRIFLMILSIALLVWAIQIRTNDVQKINCDPLSIWQGHSFWHLLTALSSFCTYAFYRFQKEI